MTDNARDLEQVRVDIDRIDRDIQALINRRAACAREVADIKLAEILAARAQGEPGQEVNYYRPEREAQVLQSIMQRNKGPLPAQEVAHIFREIVSACLALERPQQVAYLGPEGTFTQAAAIKHFGHAALCNSCATIDAVFAQVQSGSSDYGVVPVENSTEGMVSHTIDNFMNSPLKIAGEVELPITHHLLVAPDTDEAAVTCICAHQQALAQCRNWLDRHWPNVERKAVSSNGEAARLAAEGNGLAAIGGEMAAQAYQLVKIAADIADHAHNTTRFLVIGREEPPPCGRDKTSIIVSSHNKPGALFKLLDPFRRHDISLTRIDTRPSRTEKWAYVFFIEFEGHREDEQVAAVLSELAEQSILLNALGSYPRAVL